MSFIRSTLMTAHAGCMGTPPNSKENIIAAIKYDADIIEVDVRVTLDNVAVLSHDNDIILKNQRIEINKTNMQEIPQGEILTLHEALLLGKNKIFNLDIKTLDAIPAIIDNIKETNMMENYFLSGCSKQDTKYIYKKSPFIRHLLNVKKEDVLPTALAQTYAWIQEFNCCGINIDYKDLTKYFLDYARKRFIPVAVWTIDEAEIMNDFLNYGVYSITTNNLELLKNVNTGKIYHE